MKHEMGETNHESGAGAGFEELSREARKTSWAEHLRRARELVSKAIGGEKAKNSEFYLLSEHDKAAGHGSGDKKWWKDFYKEWDEEAANMPLELGEMIEKYVTNPEYRFGVHRSDAVNGADFEHDLTLERIMTEGLLNLGDASSGRIYKDPPVDKTVVLCDDMLHAILNTKASYKGSTGAVLVAIPSNLLDRDGNVMPGMESQVYDHDRDGNSLLKPEFIVGFASNLGAGTTMDFKSRDELLRGYSERG